MIDFACPQCGHKLRVKDDRAGQKGKCPHCTAALVVPTPSGVVAEAGAVPPRSSPSEDATVPPKESAAAAEVRRDTHGGADATGGAKDGARSDLTDFLAPPQGPGEIGRLGPYRVLKVLGAGGMGVVFQAEDPGLQRMVALKAMLPGLAASASARERFLREARSAAAVEHDHIVAIYQVGEDRGVPFLAMPFLKGEPLDARLKREKRLPLADVLRITRETAAGLEAARHRGMIHRDIKPANLWLEEGADRVKILDFGLARTSNDEGHLTQQGAILGTPAYMAPEQAGGKVDHRADLFSLGVVVYRMATGELPFKGSDAISTLMAIATEPARPPTEINAALPPALSDLILRLLAKKPEERPASAQALVEAIRAIEANPKGKVKAPPVAIVPAKARSGPQQLGAPPTARPTAARTAAPTAGRGAPPRTAARSAVTPLKRGGGALIFGLVALLLLAGLAVGGYFVWPYLPISVPSPPPSNPGPAPAEKDKSAPPVADRIDRDTRLHSLFNGKDLTGWVVPPKKNPKDPDNWGVEKQGADNILYTRGSDHAWLLTEKEYIDFELQLDCRFTPQANSGVGLRVPSTYLDPSVDGMEIQIIDDVGYERLPKTQTMCSLFDVAASHNAEAAPNEWHHLEITLRGRSLQVKLNRVSTPVLDVNLDSFREERPNGLPGKAVTHPGLHSPQGHIALQSHTNRVEFKNIEVRALPADK